jgi:hypothetical protein
MFLHDDMGVALGQEIVGWLNPLFVKNAMWLAVIVLDSK